jgi:hypothetical protein
MMKYQLRMYYADVLNQTAGSKATADCSFILSELGYEHFDVPIYNNKNRLLNLLTLFKHIWRLYAMLKPGDEVLLQYPLLGINRWLKYFVGLLRHKNCRTICLLHDLDSLRQVHHAWTLDEELARLSAFDRIIVHNARMKALLEDNNLKVEMRTLGLFDYLMPDNVWKALEQRHVSEIWLHEHINYAVTDATLASKYKRVAFAGNLGKSVFLKKLDQVQGISFVLYGPGYEELPNSSWMTWAGCFHANELPAKLNAAFGLIWDGDAVDTCTGHLGRYLQYNNPHKASLYLVAGIPLIAPKSSAIGDFINQYGLGITIKSLTDLPEILNTLRQADYVQMKAATIPIAKALASGAFLKSAIKD